MDAPSTTTTNTPENDVGATLVVAPTLGAVIGAFKSLTTVEYARNIRNQDWPAFRERLWQRNYYEQIVRNNEALQRTLDYISNNPANWTLDSENPAHPTNPPTPASAP